MRFMTMKWWAGEDTSDRGAEYAAYLKSIWEKLPRSVQELSRICCHDANVTRLALAVPTRMLLLDMKLTDPKTGSHLRVQYRDVEQFVSTAPGDEGLPGPRGYGDLGYDEVDVGDPGRFVHRLLFSNGIEIEITFGDVEVEEVTSSVAISGSSPRSR